LTIGQVIETKPKLIFELKYGEFQASIPLGDSDALKIVEMAFNTVKELIKLEGEKFAPPARPIKAK